MVKVCEDIFPINFDGQGNRTPGMYMNAYLRKNLDVCKKEIKKDWDMFYVVDGPEGSGKSVMAQQIGFYLDPTLDIKRITFRPEEFKEAVLGAKQYQCVIYDEAMGGLSSRGAISGTNRMLVDMMAEIRQRNLHIIIVIPSYFELDRYPAIHRTRCLIHVYHDHFKRGYFKFYSYRQKKTMYLLGKKGYNYGCVKSSFQGRFTNFYTVYKKDYKNKKAVSLRSMKKQKEEKELEKYNPIEIAFYIAAEELEWDAQILYDFSTRSGANKRYISQRIKQIEKHLLNKEEVNSKLGLKNP